MCTFLVARGALKRRPLEIEGSFVVRAILTCIGETLDIADGTDLSFAGGILVHWLYASAIVGRSEVLQFYWKHPSFITRYYYRLRVLPLRLYPRSNDLHLSMDRVVNRLGCYSFCNANVGQRAHHKLLESCTRDEEEVDLSRDCCLPLGVIDCLEGLLLQTHNRNASSRGWGARRQRHRSVGAAGGEATGTGTGHRAP